MNDWDRTQAHVVVAGAGVAGLEAVMAIRALAGDRARITLVDRAREFVYNPMTVATPFATGSSTRMPLSELARSANCDLVHDAVAEVIPAERRVVLARGTPLSYDKLIVALGAARIAAFEHATTFRGAEDVEALHALVKDVEEGHAHSIAFVVPPGIAWSLPIYELALLTAERAHAMNIAVDLTIVTPEERVLPLFGAAAGDDVGRLLENAGIGVRCGATATVPAKGMVVPEPGGDQLIVDRVVALPNVRGRFVSGLRCDADGFVPIDEFSRVPGAAGVYAAGDGTSFPVKQGGIACQQADTAAAHIARELGMAVEVKPLRPVLRGRLLTGKQPHFMRHDLRARGAHEDASSDDPLWWPPAKVAGTYLAPYLALADRTFVTR
jgi:sulfide:quinone oxidoreductase